MKRFTPKIRFLHSLKNYTRKLTNSEKKQVKARKLWTDVVSAIYQKNEKYCSENDIKSLVIERIQKFGYANPDELYEQCVKYLQDDTVITVSFNAKFLEKGLKHFSLLNGWEIGNRDRQYLSTRDHIETMEIQSIDENIKDMIYSDYATNKHARPRYGTLKLLDSNTEMVTPNYGNSFIVLKDIVKLNSLFVTDDSFWTIKDDYEIFTNHHMELFLLQASENLLRAVIERVKTGSIPTELYDQSDDYTEVQLPEINLLDPNMIESIYISKLDVEISPSIITLLKKNGINIINADTSPYNELKLKLSKTIDKNDVEEIKKLTTLYPSLKKSTHIRLFSADSNVKVIENEITPYINRLKIPK